MQMITFCYLSVVSANFAILDFKSHSHFNDVYYQGCPMFTSFYSEMKNFFKKVATFLY